MNLLIFIFIEILRLPPQPRQFFSIAGDKYEFANDVYGTDAARRIPGIVRRNVGGLEISMREWQSHGRIAVEAAAAAIQ